MLAAYIDVTAVITRSMIMRGFDISNSSLAPNLLLGFPIGI